MVWRLKDAEPPTGPDNFLAFNCFSNSLIGIKFLAKFMKSTGIASRTLTLENGTVNFLALEGFRELKSPSLGLPSHSTHDQPFLWQVIWAEEETQPVPFDHQCQPQTGPLQAPQNKYFLREIGIRWDSRSSLLWLGRSEVTNHATFPTSWFLPHPDDKVIFPTYLQAVENGSEGFLVQHQFKPPTRPSHILE